MLYLREVMGLDNGEPSDKILIVARKYEIFKSWCDIYGVNPRSRNVKFVRRLEDILERRDAWLVNLGTDDAGLNDIITHRAQAYGFREFP